MPFVQVATTAELAPGQLRVVRVPADGGARTVEVVLYRVEDRFFATQRRCLHQGGDLAEGLLRGATITCAVHGWRFELASGAHELSPETCLRTYPVRVVDGRVEIDPTPVRRPLPEMP